MEKEFKTIEEQLEILKSRGMQFPNERKASQYLLTNNYYNIINGYSKPFLGQKEQYIRGASFDEVSHLYFFDDEIKRILFHAILSAEHHIKSVFAYRFAEAHPNERYPYLDVNSYASRRILSVGYLISKLSKIININRKYDNNAISYYVRKYENVPIWVLVDFIDFGELESLIRNLSTRIQNKIAKDLTSFIYDNIPNFEGQFQPEVMLSLIKNIHEVRNICAHNKRLLSFNCQGDSMFFPPLHSKYNITPDDHRRDVYTTFLSMQCFLSKMEYAQLNNSIRKKMNVLKNHIYTIDLNSVLSLYGFPNDWYRLPKIPQE